MPSPVTGAEVLGRDRSSVASGAETQGLIMIITEILQVMVGVPRLPWVPVGGVSPPARADKMLWPKHLILCIEGWPRSLSL